MTDQAAELRNLVRLTDQKKNNRTPAPGKMRIITIASGKGGVGKSNIVVNLAIMLAQREQKVIIFDADMGLANVDVLLGLIPRYTLWEVIKGEKTLKEVLLEGPGGIKIIPGGSGIHELANIDNYQRQCLVHQLRGMGEKTNFLLIDTGGGISRNVLGFMTAAEEVVIVLTPEPTSLTDAYGVIKVLSRLGLHSKIGLIVNRASNSREANSTVQRIERVVQRFLGMKTEYLGYICDDRLVSQAVKKQEPFCLLYPRSTAARCLGNVASTILEAGKLEREPSFSADKFVNRLLRLFT